MAQRIPTQEPPEARRTVMTYEEWLALPEDMTSEWVDGEVIYFMPPKRVHQRVVLFLARLMAQYADLMRLGEVLVAPFEMRLASARSSREPDIVFVTTEHADRLTADRLDGPADLAVEVISDDSVTRDRRDKLLEYQRAGVPEYWVIDARERQHLIEPFMLTERGVYRQIPLDESGRLYSRVLPGFWIDPDWLWQDPLPDPLRLLRTIAPEAVRSVLSEGED